MSADRVSVHAAAALVRSHFATRYLNPATEHKYQQNTERLVRHFDAHGIEFVDQITEQIVVDYIWSGRRRHGSAIDVSATTASSCRSMTIAFFDVLIGLSIWERLPPVGPPIERDRPDGSLPLTPDQIVQLEQAVSGLLFSSRASLLIALSEAGADAPEIAAATWSDIDLDSGNVAFNLDAPRTNPLTDWGVDALRASWRAGVDPAERICVRNSVGVRRGAQSVTVGLSDLLRDAGLSHLPGITARSIRLGVARQFLLVDGLESAARFLGSRSLDATAASLRYDWESN